MQDSVKTNLTPANRRELDEHLRKAWGLGANVIVGWRILPFGIQALTISSYELPNLGDEAARLLGDDRHIGSDAEAERLLKLGCKEHRLDLSFGVTEDAHMIALVNGLVQNFTVAYAPGRAVALFDIVSFSVHTPLEQVTQVSVLSHYLMLAAQRCRSLGLDISMQMTTTGDGFYVWNRNDGLAADMALVVTVMLALGYIAAAREMAAQASVPRLRLCVHYGDHFEYYQGGRHGTGSYIVGNVTIDLARLSTKALTGQLIVGAFERRLGPGDGEIASQLGIDRLETPAFMALAQTEMMKLKDLRIPGGRIDNVNMFVTGPRVSEDTFSIRKYYVPDKHGLEHGCYNAKLNIFTNKGKRLAFGMLDVDLGKFDARSDELEDILIKVA